MFFLLYKPKGISSFEAVKRFKERYLLPQLGHSGTLDPLATGALLVATGSDTKLIEFISEKDKSYEVVLSLCFTSDTLDVTGDISPVLNCKLPTISEIYQAFEIVSSRTSQLPPIFSAKKQGGVRAYKLARGLRPVNLKPIPVKIFAWNITGISVNQIRFKIRVSEGTYIRSFVRDIGEQLGCQAIMNQLYRYKIGDNRLKGLVELLSEEDLFKQPRIVVNERQARLIWDGRLECLGSIKGLVAIKFKDRIIGFCEGDGKAVKLRKLLGNKLSSLLHEGAN